MFYAEQVWALSRSDADRVSLAQTYFEQRQYRRALHLLNQDGDQTLLQADAKARHLAARCLLELRLWDECLELLDAQELERLEQALPGAGAAASEGSGTMEDDGEGEAGERRLLVAGLWSARGRALEAQENAARATECYERALRVDARCHEALERLADARLLTPSRAQKLLQHEARFPRSAEAALLRRLYSLRLGLASPPQPPEDGSEEVAGPGGESLEERLAWGEAAFEAGDFATAAELAGAAAAADPWHGLARLTALQAAALLELGAPQRHRLYLLAQRLVQDWPERGISWHAVGLYYLSCGRWEAARRHLARATQLEPTLAPAWLAFGHALAQLSEHDQAMAAYRSAARLAPASPAPLLAVASELMRVHNLPQAAHMLAQAAQLAPDDPLLLNELGVLALRSRDPHLALRHLRRALELLQQEARGGAQQQRTRRRRRRSGDGTLEAALYTNLADAHRRLGDYPAAQTALQAALALPAGRTPSTYLALAFCHHLAGQLSRALDLYHQALALRPDDSLAQDLLQRALSHPAAFQFTA